jgi:hypothetical protein
MVHVAFHQVPQGLDRRSRSTKVTLHAAIPRHDVEALERRPVDLARHRLQPVLGLAADHPGLHAAGEECADEPHLAAAQLSAGPVQREPAARDVLDQPRDEEEVADPRVQHRGAREQGVGEAVPDGADTELVDARLVLEELDDLGHRRPLRVVLVEPAEGRAHA